MQTIHHATAKKAAAEGIDLQVTDQNTVAATFAAGSTERTITAPVAKTALEAALLGRMLESEYGIRLEHDGEGEWGISAPGCGYVMSGPGDLPKLEAVIEAAVEAGYDPDAFEAEDDGPKRPVVPASYKRLYAEGGHPANCGDWLATWLEDETHDADGNIDMAVFDAILDANAVDRSGKWNALPESGQRGWQGRYRMNGRQKLEVAIAVAGQLLDAGGNKVKMPKAEVAALQAKHGKAIAKAAKAA